jgi:[ribosomal protein S5]-alanine N-acetyltransferase
MKFIPRPLLKIIKKQIILGDQQIDLNLWINWALTLKPNKELIGIIGFYRTKQAHFRSEIEFMIVPKFRGKGLVS